LQLGFNLAGDESPGLGEIATEIRHLNEQLLSSLIPFFARAAGSI